MAGYRETFGSNVDYAYGRGVNDVTGRLQRGVAGLGSSSKALSDLTSRAQAARKGIRDLGSELRDLQSQRGAAILKGNTQAVASLTRRIEKARDALKGMKGQLRQMPFDAFERGLGRITKGLVGFNTGLLSISFDFIISSIKRVYELQERWTRAIGGFNMRIGGMTSGLKGATRAATAWSSTIRGLTNGDINEGIQMFGDFTDAIGRTVESGDQFAKFGVQLARGFNLGGQGAGQLTKVFQNIGDSGDDAAETMKALVKGANAAHVPTNLLAKDIAESSVYMARFGKEGQKTFVTGAAWARRYTISINQLKGAVEGLDMFDEAAKTAAKLNTAFGTMINSMDLMMEDDPAKRLEMIRQQFLAQGTTFDRLTPKQRRYLSETLHLTEDQTAALLDAKNANESYADFQAKAQRREKNDLDAKRLMQKQLQATAQTMYAFGMAFDRVTLAIAKAIRPLLEVLGLAKKGGKDFSSFGQVMESITKTVVHFFESLAGNDRWMNFMRELGKDLQRAGTGLKNFVMDGRAADLVGDIAVGMKNFYVTVRDLAIRAVPLFRPLLDVLMLLSKHITGIALAWGGMKLFNGLGGMTGKGPMGALGRVLGPKGVGRIGMAGAAGAVGGMIGGTGAGIGAAAGSLVGGMFGPLGMVLGPIVGGLAGKAISWIFGSSKVKSALEKAHEDLAATMKREGMRREALTAVLDAAQARNEAQDRLRESKNRILQGMENVALKQKDKTITLNSAEAEMLRARATELSLFSRSTRVSRDMLDKLGAGSKLTAGQIKDLLTGSQAYETELSKLRDLTQKQAELEMARLQVSNLGQQKEALELTTKLHDMEVKSAKAQLEGMGGKVSRKGLLERGLIGGANATAAGVLDQANKGFIKINDKERARLELEAKIDKLDMANTMDQKKLIQAQTDFFKQEVIIKLRQAIMSDAKFLEFQKSKAESGKTLDQQLMDFLESGQSAVASDPAVRDLLREGSNFSAVSAAVRASGPTRPPPANSVFNRPAPYNFAAPPPSAASTSVVSTVAEVHLDGQKVGRAIVKSTIQDRR